MYAKINFYECEECTYCVSVCLCTYRHMYKWKTIIHGYLTFCTSCVSFCFGLSRLFVQQTALEGRNSVSFWDRRQRADFFFTVRIKSIMPPSRVKAGQVHQQPSLKDYGFLKSGLLVHSNITFCCLFEYVCKGPAQKNLIFLSFPHSPSPPIRLGLIWVALFSLFQCSSLFIEVGIRARI